MIFKHLTFLVIAALALSACQKRPSSTSDALPAGIGIYEPQDIPLIEKGRLAQSERVRATMALFQVLKDNYVLWSFTSKLKKINPTRIAQSCIASEMAIDGASYRSDFLDRLKICIGDLNDSHLNLTTSMKRSLLISPVGDLVEIDGKITIASIRRELLTHAMTNNSQLNDLEQILVPGAELLKIDNMQAAHAIHLTEKYYSSSTPEARRAEAVSGFFNRSFAFPKKKTVLLDVLTAGKRKSVEIPWYYSSAADLESDVLLGELNIPDRRALNISSGQSGFWQGDPIYRADELVNMERFFVDENQQDDFITFGFLKNNPQKCYMKVHTFSLNNKKTYKADKLPLEASMVIEQLLLRCEAANAELILDLNYNSGGDLMLSSQLLSALLPETVDAKVLRSFSTAKNIWDVANVYRIWTQEDESYRIQYQTLSEAILNGKPTTDWLVRDVGSEISGVFSSGKLTVIVSPFCVSACDALVTGLKAAHRGTLIGTPANGTGAGFLSVSRTSTLYIDANNLIRLDIPNQLFSVVVKNSDEPTLPFNESYIIEGKAAQPDIPYSLTLKDITDNFADLKKVLEK